MLSVQMQMLGTVSGIRRRDRTCSVFSFLVWSRVFELPPLHTIPGILIMSPFGNILYLCCLKPHDLTCKNTCFNCKNTRICYLKRNHILTQNIFLHVSSSHVLEETATSEALSSSLCPQTKPLSVVPFPLHPFRRLLIPVVFWFLGF